MRCNSFCDQSPILVTHTVEFAMGEQVVPRKCGVRFSPPAIVVTYSSGGHLHRRTMPLRNFTKNSGVNRAATQLRENTRHAKYLSTLPPQQLEKLIAIIHDKLNGLSLEDSLQKNSTVYSVDPDEDLNKVDSTTLVRKKDIMQASFDKHSCKPGDKDFKYDIEVDFKGAIQSCDWDSEESDNEF